MAGPLDPYLPLLYALGAIAAWTVAIYVLDRRGVLAKRNMVAMGPFLMVKTRRGREFIDRVSRHRRAWAFFGDACIAIVGITMVGITALLVWEATIVHNIPADRAPTPEMLLGIPGINPVIPLGYGIFALAIAVGIHEFMHGILARVAKVKIESLGVLFTIFPIGAFVEPAEAEMKVLPRRDRARIYSVGAGVNMLLALLFAVLFSSMMMGGVAPAQAGVGILAFTSDANGAWPAYNATNPDGALLHGIITRVNGTDTPGLLEFQAAMAQTRPGDNITIVVWKDGALTSHNITLGDDGTGRAILGIRAADTSTAYYHPLTDTDRFGGVPGALLIYISLPFTGRAPLQEPTTEFYVLTGPWASVPEPAFYLIANALYWLFWLNLMLGATNALPAVPLDGGFVFRDGLEALLARLRRGQLPAGRERTVRNVSYAFAFLILALIMWQFIGPRI